MKSFSGSSKRKKPLSSEEDEGRGGEEERVRGTSFHCPVGGGQWGSRRKDALC